MFMPCLPVGSVGCYAAGIIRKGIIMNCFRHGVTIAIAGFVVFTASAEELKTTPEVLEFSSAKMASYKTWSADYLQSLNMPGGEMAVSGRMLQKPPHRMWMQLTMPMMGQQGKMTMVLGEDGVLWQIMEIANRPQIMKADMNKVKSDTASLTGGKFDPLDQMDPSRQWETSRKMYDFKLVTARERDGPGVYVLEGLSKPSSATNQLMAAQAAGLGKMRVSLGKDDGFIHRMEMYDKSLTNVVTTMEFKNLKFNTDIPDATFVYEPATNAAVRDITAMFEMQVRARQGNSAPAAPEPGPSRSAPPVPKAE
jgi:outer membrane lipoprotein-sorting protein